MRRSVLSVVSAIGIAALALGPVAPVQAGPSATGTARPPDVIFVLVDDLGALNGRRLWKYMPNIRDIFLNQGVSFTDFHGESPLCCPGRAGFLTGQHTFNHGVDRNDARLLKPSMTLATQMDRAGYHTFLTGKYLNLYNLLAPTVPPGWDRFNALSTGAYYDYDIWNNGGPTPERHGSRPADYSTDVIAARAVENIRTAPRGRPIFGWITPYAPHGPTTAAPRYTSGSGCGTIGTWSPPNYNEADVSDKPAYVRAMPLLKTSGYDLRPVCKSMRAVDDLVGRVRDELEAQGRWENTILVLSSDNGMNYGAHRLDRKRRPYATDIPFFVSWPAGLGTSPRQVDERLENIDFAPTICELAGCTMGPYPNGQTGPDGRSFAAVLRGAASSVGRDAVIEDMPDDDPSWHAVATTGLSPLATIGCSAASSGGCRWHYVEYDTGERELYDVSNGPCWAWRVGEPGDPCELDNRAGRAAYAQIQKALATRLAALRQERGTSTSR